MTIFTKEQELKELAKDYNKNKTEIFNIVYDYIKENEDEIVNRWSKEYFKNFVDIKNI